MVERSHPMTFFLFLTMVDDDTTEVSSDLAA